MSSQRSMWSDIDDSHTVGQVRQDHDRGHGREHVIVRAALAINEHQFADAGLRGNHFGSDRDHERKTKGDPESGEDGVLGGRQ